MLGNRGLVFERGERPRPRGVRVGHRLLRGEGLGRNDEQRLGRVEVVRGFGEVGAVDVGHEAERQVARAVVAQGFVGHDRAEVRSADADVDDGANALARVAFPFAAADAIGELGHLVQHGVNFRHDVLAIDEDLRVTRRAQGHVQHGAVLGEVDLVAAEHRVDAFAQAAVCGEVHQQLQGLGGEAMLGVIQIQPQRFEREAFAALRVLRKQRPELNVFDLLIVSGQRLPRRALS